MSRTSAALAALWLSALAAPASASQEIAHVVIGRLVHPKGLWVVHNNFKYAADRFKDPSQDEVQAETEADYGLTDTLMVGAGIGSRKARRDFFQADHLSFEAAYLLPVEAFQAAPSARFFPSLRGELAAWRFGLPLLKNLGRFSALIETAVELERGPDGRRKTGAVLEPGLLYRFGLHGIIGTELELESEGKRKLELILGGNVSRNLFLAMEPEFGLSAKSPDLALRIQLHLLFGPYSLGSWGIE